MVTMKERKTQLQGAQTHGVYAASNGKPCAGPDRPLRPAEEGWREDTDRRLGGLSFHPSVFPLTMF